MTKKLTTVTQAARELKHSTSWVRSMCIKHNIGKNDYGRLRLLTERDLHRLAIISKNATIGRPKKILKTAC